MPELRFTSEQALRRSISQKYPKLSMEQKMATFEQNKQFIGVTTDAKLEAFLEKKYQDYKKTEANKLK